MTIDLQTVLADGEFLRRNGADLDGEALTTLAVDDPTELDLSTVGAISTLTIMDTIARASKPVNVQTGTAYTLALADVDAVVTMNNAGASTLTLPQDSAVPIPVGAQGVVICLGAGDVTMTQGTGATMIGGAVLQEPGWRCFWTKIAANTFVITSPEYATWLQNVVHQITYDHTLLRQTLFSTPLSATSTAVNNSLTLVNCTGMSLSLAASAVYEIEGYVPYQSGATADMKIGWTIPSGATGLWSAGGLSSSITITEGDYKSLGVTWGSTSSVGAISGTTMECRPKGLMRTTNAGTLQFQFAQQALEVIDTTIRAQAYLKATRIS